MQVRNRGVYGAAAAAVALAVGGVGIAAASSGPTAAEAPGSQTPAQERSQAPGKEGSESPAEEAIHGPDSNGSRLDDGAGLLPQAKISEQDAIAAAQTAASGPLSEVDLEDYQGQLVFNVDVGSHDVKVDAATGEVLAAPQDE